MQKAKDIFFITLSGLIVFTLGWFANEYYKSKLNVTPDPISAIKQRPLEKYKIERLSKNTAPSVDIKIEEELEEGEGFNSYLISFSFDPTLSGKEEKKVTGLLNIPKTNDEDEKFPVVVLFRGYVDQTLYETGIGTKRVGEYLADNDYITIAPDFLGYAGSDTEAENIFESRFQTYTTALTLLNSISSIDSWNGENVYIWGHSNGGQIAITVLEITRHDYPTVLWAPVTKPFPYSILYYTDESEDRGKLIRRELSKFETDYDVEKYSLTNYLDRLNAPIQLHQGTADDAVPKDWSDSFVKEIENTNEDYPIEYITHYGADHNMNPNWSSAVASTLKFFQTEGK